MALLTITDTANDHLSDIIKEQNAKGVMLEIRAGGCAGFAYEWIILKEEIPDEFNTEAKFELKTGYLCIHPHAMMFVVNTIIDFTSNISGSYLKIVNPNATSQCGCGESFSV